MAQEDRQEAVPSIGVVLAWNVYKRRRDMVPPWSREELATRSGVSEATILKIENERLPDKAKGYSPEMDTVGKLAQGFGCSYSEIVEWPTRVVLHGESSSLALLPGGGTGGSYDLPLIAALPGLAP